MCKIMLLFALLSFFGFLAAPTKAFKLPSSKNSLFLSRARPIETITINPNLSIQFDKPYALPMVPIPPDNMGGLTRNEEGTRVSATFTSFFLGLRYFGLIGAIVSMFLGHFLVQKSSLIGQSIKAIGFLTYAVVSFITDVWKGIKNMESSKSSGTSRSMEDIENKWEELRVNERLGAVFDFSDQALEKFSEFFDTARKEV